MFNWLLRIILRKRLNLLEGEIKKTCKQYHKFRDLDESKQKLAYQSKLHGLEMARDFLLGNADLYL